MRRRAGGFTMVELVMVIIMLGILAVFVMPRMDTSAYRALEFHDKTVAALRYAQKTATSHRRLVCVAFSDDHTLALTIDHDKSGACDGQPLNLPGANSNILQSSDPTNAVFTAAPPASLNFNFNSDGSGSEDRSIAINGAATAITVYGATGYVQ